MNKTETAKIRATKSADQGESPYHQIPNNGFVNIFYRDTT